MTLVFKYKECNSAIKPFRFLFYHLNLKMKDDVSDIDRKFWNEKKRKAYDGLKLDLERKYNAKDIHYPGNHPDNNRLELALVE